MSEPSPPSRGPGQAWTPIPDPTVLTASMVDAAKAELRRELISVRELIETRLDAMDQAMTLFQATLAVVPSQTDREVTHLKELLVEKFTGVAQQFDERDKRLIQAGTAAKMAVDAALEAQRDAVEAQNANIAQALARIEATGTKQIDQITTLFQTTVGGLDSKNADLKERLTLIEGRTAGITAHTSQQQGNQSYVLALVGFLVGSLIGLAGLIFALMKGHS